MVPMASGAGIGQVGELPGAGQLVRGGVPRSLFFVWLYGVDNPMRAAASRRSRRGDARACRAIQRSRRDQAQGHLVKADQASARRRDADRPGRTARDLEQLIARTPADPAWREGGLYHDDMGWGVPALWFNSWYDVSIGPNMELFNHARATSTDAEASANQYAVIAPEQPLRLRGAGPGLQVGRPRARRSPASMSMARCSAGSTAG